MFGDDPGVWFQKLVCLQSVDDLCPWVYFVWRIGEDDVVLVAFEFREDVDCVGSVGCYSGLESSSLGLGFDFSSSSVVDLDEVDMFGSVFQEIETYGAGPGEEFKDGHPLCSIRSQHGDDG